MNEGFVRDDGFHRTPFKEKTTDVNPMDRQRTKDPQGCIWRRKIDYRSDIGKSGG